MQELFQVHTRRSRDREADDKMSERERWSPGFTKMFNQLSVEEQEKVIERIKEMNEEEDED